jgi:type IV secretory pathway VirD2 relaxase
MKEEGTDEVSAEVVRAADEAERARIWADLVDEFGSTEASRRWMAIFAATDAPRTG